MLPNVGALLTGAMLLNAGAVLSSSCFIFRVASSMLGEALTMNLFSALDLRLQVFVVGKTAFILFHDVTVDGIGV